MGFIFLFCLYFYFLLKTRIQTISALSDTRVDPTSQRAELTIMRLFKMGHATDRKTCQGVNISKRYLRCKHYSYVYFYFISYDCISIHIDYTADMEFLLSVIVNSVHKCQALVSESFNASAASYSAISTENIYQEHFDN